MSDMSLISPELSVEVLLPGSMLPMNGEPKEST